MMKLNMYFIIFLFVGTFSINLHASNYNIGKRQVHLDFHTSEKLFEIGQNFSKDQFQEALKLGKIDAINIFAKCHHSWSYYPTKVGKMHPNLDFDLLGAQIEACHEIGVLAPLYYTFGWSHIDAIENKEWIARQENGKYMNSSQPYDLRAKDDTPKPSFQWFHMCVNTSYHDHIMKQIEEICQLYPVDGLWFDIYQVANPCYGKECKKLMKKQGYDVKNKQDVYKFQAESFKRHQSDLTRLIHSYHPNATIYFNGCTTLKRGAQNFKHKMYEYNTVQDLEDLPTTWGGYDKLPIQSKFFLAAGYPITAMSGKFHKAWGEFGGFKHPNALKYEAASMISWGANCNFGDQLHPNGEMDLETYRNIGFAYDYVKSIENFGIGGIPESKIALWRSFNQEHDEGITRMLLESQINFTIANIGDQELSKFELIIVPGVPCMSPEEADRVNNFVKKGGKLLVLGEGALDWNKQKLQLDIGATYIGPGAYDRDYLVVDKELGDGLVSTPFLFYKSATKVQPNDSSKILAHIREPYFSRTYGAFTSHQNTPYKLNNALHPGIIKNGNVIYIAHKLDEMYYKHGAYLHRDLFKNCLKSLNFKPMVEVDLPSTGRISLLHQKDKKRYVSHLLYASPITRGACEVIEDLPHLNNVKLIVDLPEKIKKATLIPSMEQLKMVKNNNQIEVIIPSFSCHCAVSFEYE